MKIKTCCIGIMLGVLYNLSCIAQQSYRYAYDQNGNRMLRTIVLPSKSQSQLGSTQKDYRETIEELEITFFPNPTQGEVMVNFKNMEETESAVVSIYNFSGHLLRTYSGIRDSGIIDLTEYPQGIYIMRITVGTKKTEWKIVKD